MAVVVLPVDWCARGAEVWPADAFCAEVVDLNAFRYWRERAAVERREMQSLLPELGSPCDCGVT